MYVRIQGCLFRTYVCTSSYKNVEKLRFEKSLLLSVDLVDLSDMPVYNQVRLRNMYVVFNVIGWGLKSPRKLEKRRVLSLWHLVVKKKSYFLRPFLIYCFWQCHLVLVLWQTNGIILQFLLLPVTTVSFIKILKIHEFLALSFTF